jgi:hypothetical protein
MGFEVTGYGSCRYIRDNTGEFGLPTLSVPHLGKRNLPDHVGVYCTWRTHFRPIREKYTIFLIL